MFKKIITIILLITIVSLSFYSSKDGYLLATKLNNKVFGERSFIIRQIDYLVYQLDFRRSIKKLLPDKIEYIDLNLSRGDLDFLQNRKDEFLEIGFIKDSKNPWRTGEILINQSLIKIKFKIHGTSISPIRRGGASLRIKHKKQPPYYQSTRDFKLITAYDEADISTVILNKIAKQYGLVAPERSLVNLRINGNNMGLYQFEEHHSKEWFEQKLQLTNYTIIKSNDDWDRKENNAHTSNTDLWVENKEYKGSSDSPSIALGMLELLLEAIRESDINQIRKLIDIDYFARYVAYFSILNNNHPITGDNLKYIYDHTSGKFTILFRLEDTLFPLSTDIEAFSHSWLHTQKEYSDSETHKLFKILLQDPDFVSLRNKYLNLIINDENSFLEKAEEIFTENEETLYANSNNLPRHKILYEKDLFFSNLRKNIEIAKEYLNYQKVFISIDKTSKNQKIHIINDSFHDLFFDHVEMIAENYIKPLEENKINIKEKNTYKLNVNIPQSIIDENFNQNVHRQEFIINSLEEISNFVILNKITGKRLTKEDIYINYKTPTIFPSEIETFAILDSNNISYEKLNKKIIIKSGLYEIKETISIPETYSVVIEPDTTIQMSADVSFLIKGDLEALGTKDSPIIINNLQKDQPFGTFAIIGKFHKANVNIKHLKISGGSESTVEGIKFLGQMSIHNANVLADNIHITNSYSDDGINIRNSNIDIRNSKFSNNLFDQVDLDFCEGIIESSDFLVKPVEASVIANGDGLDLSGSRVNIVNNRFQYFSDKAISIGEESTALLNNNNISLSKIGVAIKDGSDVYVLNNNSLIQNKEDISLYIKKSFYSPPKLYINKGLTDYRLTINDGTIEELDKNLINNIFG